MQQCPFVQCCSFTEHVSDISALAFQPSPGKRIAVGYADGQLTLYDLESQKAVQACKLGESASSAANELQWSPRGQYIFVAKDDCTIDVYDWRASAVAISLRGHSGSVTGVQIHPYSPLLCSCSTDGSLRFWDVRTSLTLLEVTASKTPILSMTSDTSMMCVAIGTADGIVRLINTSTGEIYSGVYTDRNRGPVISLDFVTRKRLLLLAMKDWPIKLWDVCSSKPLQNYYGAQFGDYLVKSAIMGDYVISGSSDGEVVIWNSETGNVISKIDHKLPVLVIDCQKEENMFASATFGREDRKLLIWQHSS